MRRSGILSVLDVGTTKVCALSAEIGQQRISIRGAGVCPSAGLRKGIVIDIDAASRAIRRAIGEAENASGARIREVTVSVSGAHLQGVTGYGATVVQRQKVTPADVDRAIDSANAVCIPLDREILHAVPSEFILDGRKGIPNPVGMEGDRLEARVHIITSAVAHRQNLMAACEKAGVKVVEPFCDAYASAHAVLTTEEKQSGVVLVDIGGGTTSIAYFREGTLRQISVLGVGGNHITNDISAGLRVSFTEAERLKKTFGCVFGGASSDAEELQICLPDGEKRTLPRIYLTGIIEARCEEMVSMVREEIQSCAGYETAPKRVVLAGGSSLLRGVTRMAESVLGIPVRIGTPGNTTGFRAVPQGPAYSSAIGLALLLPGTCHVGEVPADAFISLFSRMKDRFKGACKVDDLLYLINRKEGGMTCLKSRK